MIKVVTSIFLFLTFSVAAQPVIKGGVESFVKANLVYPSYSLYNCIEGNVMLSLQLTKRGNVYNAKILSGVGTDLDKEALRILRKSSGKWSIPDHYDTTTVVIVPINFQLEGYDCQNRSQAEIQRAINAYEVNEGLTQAIQNFYRNKAAGVYKKEDETRYLTLKEELGYDEAYMESKIAKGKEKLKQNDRIGACEDFHFVKNMGFTLADQLIKQNCP